MFAMVDTEQFVIDVRKLPGPIALANRPFFDPPVHFVAFSVNHLGTVLLLSIVSCLWQILCCVKWTKIILTKSASKS